MAGGEIPAAVDSGEIATNTAHSRLVDAIEVLDGMGWDPNQSGPAIGLDDFDDEHQKATFLRVSGRSSERQLGALDPG